MTIFDQFNLDYSLKNIPISNRNEYMIQLISKTRDFLRRMRLKAYFYEKERYKDADEKRKMTFGFKSKFNPPPEKNLLDFEKDFIAMICNIKFRKFTNDFQKKMQKDIAMIRKENRIIVKADKTSNMYRVDPGNYRKLLHDNITNGYKITKENVLASINDEAKEIAVDLELDDRINAMPIRDAYVTLKDHKENFNCKPKCRLINPTKSEIGKISKKILEKINTSIREQTRTNQWTDTQQVINWFNHLNNKKNLKFIKFDVIEFYPSITENLLRKAIEFGQKYIAITSHDQKIIFNATKSVLANDDKIWIKKRSGGSPLFDITMGGYHGAEVCELVGLFMLHGLSDILKKEQVGLYRDDGLAVIEHLTDFKAEKLKVRLHKFAKELGLRLEIEGPMTKTVFLDITMDLNKNTYGPYRKKNSITQYINTGSNHPHNIIRQLPNMISRRISSRSSNLQEFQKAEDHYNKALEQSGHKEKVAYEQKKTKAKKRNKRKAIWFNPPFCRSVKTNVKRTFINLVNRHFGDKNPLSKIFNKNTINCSYSCMPSIDRVINHHNKKILKETKTKGETKPCNCKKEPCPLKPVDKSCNTESVIYKAYVETLEEKRTYIGLTGNEFKKRWYRHKESLTKEKYKDDTELSKYIWKLKGKNIKYNLKWDIMKTVNKIQNGGRDCRLCLTEALEIMKNRENPLNKRNEIMGACRHRNKFTLRKWQTEKEKTIIEENKKKKAKEKQ